MLLPQERYITMQATAKFSKLDRKWVIAIVQGRKIPEDKIVLVERTGHEAKPVKLLKKVGEKPLTHAVLDLYDFAQVDDSLPSRQ